MAGLRTQSFANNGQTCYLNSRILAPRSRYDEVVDAMAALADGLVVGDPLDPATDIGPVVSEKQRERILGYIAAGTADGAKLVAGGSIPKDQPRGWFVEPTIFADVKNSDRIAREEIFGPVLSVIRFGDEADVIRQANDSSYGLQASVWSDNINRAHRVARALRAGTVHVNQYDEDDITVPFGGYKQSGNGRDKSLHAFDKYTELKTTWLRIDAA